MGLFFRARELIDQQITAFETSDCYLALAVINWWFNNQRNGA